MASQICKGPLLRVPMMSLHSQYEKEDKFSAAQQLKYHKSIRTGAITGRLTSAACDAALPKASIAMAQVPRAGGQGVFGSGTGLGNKSSSEGMNLLKRMRMLTG